jgi:hypothetical protein
MLCEMAGRFSVPKIDGIVSSDRKFSFTCAPSHMLLKYPRQSIAKSLANALADVRDEIGSILWQMSLNRDEDGRSLEKSDVINEMRRQLNSFEEEISKAAQEINNSKEEAKSLIVNQSSVRTRSSSL